MELWVLVEKILFNLTGMLYSKSNCPIGDINFHSCAWDMIKTAQSSCPDLIVFPPVEQMEIVLRYENATKAQYGNVISSA